MAVRSLFTESAAPVAPLLGADGALTLESKSLVDFLTRADFGAVFEHVDMKSRLVKLGEAEVLRGRDVVAVSDLDEMASDFIGSLDSPAKSLTEQAIRHAWQQRGGCDPTKSFSECAVNLKNVVKESLKTLLAVGVVRKAVGVIDETKDAQRAREKSVVEALKKPANESNDATAPIFGCGVARNNKIVTVSTTSARIPSTPANTTESKKPDMKSPVLLEGARLAQAMMPSISRQPLTEAKS